MKTNLVNLGVHFSIAAVLVVTSLPASAASVGLRASTLGLGVESTQSLYRKVNTRFGINYFSIDQDGTQDDVDYEADFSLQSVHALIDWHPFAGRFRLTGGLLLNGNSLELNSQANASYDIGNETYTSDDLVIKGDLNFQPVAPYLSIGWGLPPSKKSAWGFTAELGIIYMGEVDVALDANGTATTQGNPNPINVTDDAVFQENLAREERALEEDIEDYVFYPLVSVGVSYVF